MGKRALSALATVCVVGASVVGVGACGSNDAQRRPHPRDGGDSDAEVGTGGGASTGSGGRATSGSGGVSTGTGGTASGGTSGAGGTEPDASIDTPDSGAGGATPELDGGTTPPIKQDAGSGPGVLEVDLVHAPNGGDVTIEGPDGFKIHITRSTTLVGLQFGAYFATSKDVRPATGNVMKANPARSSADVIDATKGMMHIDYGTVGIPVAASANLPNGIWFTLSGHLVSLPLNAPDGDYNADVIYELNPAVTDPVQSPTALAFDGKGGLWLADSLHQSIGRIAARADVTGALGQIDLSAQHIYPYALAFDKNNNLWVDGQNADVSNAVKVLGFSAASLNTLTAPVNPSSTYSISNVGNTEQIAFDTTGNLWMSYPQVGNVGVFLPALTTTNVANLTYLQNKTWNPQVPLNSNLSPRGVTFDAGGNLWSANQKSNEVVGYLAANLTSAISSRTPDFHFSLPEPMVNGTWGPARLAIDPCSSQLYVLTVTSGAERIFRYDISDPAAPVLKATITSPDIGIWLEPMGMATNPVPPGIPLDKVPCPAP